MSAPRWIHCNICLHLLSRKERKFYHLSCRHVLCRQCMGKTNRGTICPVCNKPLERFTELSNQMDRKEKMLYDSGSLKLLSVAYQSVIFQHKQRQNMIRGILRCRKAIVQMKDMEDSLRQKIVETQRRYEKFRTYRRNLQETLRQISPRYGNGPLMGASGRTAIPQIANRPTALSNRDCDPDSRRYDRKRTTTTVSSNVINFDTPSLTMRPTATVSSNVVSFDTPSLTMRPTSTLSSNVVSFDTPSLTNRPSHKVPFNTPSLTNRPSSILEGSFTRQHVTMMHSQPSNTGHLMEVNDKIGGTSMNALANDSGISGMQTPSSNFSYGANSIIGGHRHGRQHTPSTPARYHAGGVSFLDDQMMSSIKRRL
ncbi:uncharacterized protein LOC128303522 isoform X2 [Anopheles moucheti]|uniref:uncharacterized protein LOC128303522 isoform X2 n=1 Tax=Anopheles moucheti TaxID=186751 RepID=UPI0022F0E7D0|nr:uncharacterized protein LOC128303522 isoform X2 [Anopheles moucheti]